MWGFYNQRDRNLSKQIFNDIIDQNIAKQYNSRPINSKGQDQFFLSSYVYQKIKKNSVIHDSYLCLMYNDSEPFPTKRVGNCFVGGENALSCINETFKDCPVQCRPQNHQDWNTC